MINDGVKRRDFFTVDDSEIPSGMPGLMELIAFPVPHPNAVSISPIQ